MSVLGDFVLRVYTLTPMWLLLFLYSVWRHRYNDAKRRESFSVRVDIFGMTRGNVTHIYRLHIGFFG